MAQPPKEWPNQADAETTFNAARRGGNSSITGRVTIGETVEPGDLGAVTSSNRPPDRPADIDRPDLGWMNGEPTGWNRPGK